MAPPSDADYDNLFKAIEGKMPVLVNLLSAAVAIPSVSAEPARRPDVVRMINWTKQELEKLGVKCELVDIGEEKLHDGGSIALPPLIFGQLGSDPAKKTVLIYAHLDVQPAAKEDGWNTDPFTLTEVDEKLFGRGSTDDKGPMIAWFVAIQTLQELGIDIPVNIKFVLEGMEESGSLGLDAALRKAKDSFLSDISFTCISDNYWLGKTKPCITYGLRGICYFFAEVECAKQDLHSGVYGGTMHEAMNDLVWLFAQLTDVNGNIKIPGLNEMVAPLTAEEEKLYTDMDFDTKDFKNDIGAHGLVHNSKEKTLQAKMRHPSLSIHGFEGAFSSGGAKTVIPAKVIGKFSIRIVPNMEPEVVDKLVVEHLNGLWQQRHSPNKFKATPFHNGRCWVGDHQDKNYQAGARALKKVFGVDPDFTREGGSIPITITFQEVTGNSVMLLPLGAADDMAHSQNEKMNKSNLLRGTQALAAYLLELAHA